MANTAGTEAQEVGGALVGMRIDELISSLAIGIAEGQMQLDDACRQIAQFMGEPVISFGKRPGTDEIEKHSLIELGFTPNFYQFVDTILEVRVAVSANYTETNEVHTANVVTDEQASQTSATDQWNSAYSQSGGGYYGSYGWYWGWPYGYGSNNYASSSSSASARSSATQRKSVTVNTVDAKYASTYQYAVEGSSVIKTKLVPIPPPNVLEELIRDRARLQKIENDQALLRDAAKKILPDAQSALKDLAATELTKSAANITTIRMTAFGAALTAMAMEMARFTRDHWIAMGAESSGAAVATALDQLNANKESMQAVLGDSTTSVELPDGTVASNGAQAKVIGDALTTANDKLYPTPPVP